MRGRASLLALLGLLATPALRAADPASGAAMAELSIERGADGTRQALVRNRLAGPIHVRVHDAARPREVIEATLEAGETRAIGRFGGEGAPDLRLVARPGAPQLLPPGQRGVYYAFPLPAGSAWRLTQGFGGRASHRDAANFHALDLAAAEGTPVLAARTGTVMQVVDTFTEGGMDEALKERMNLVRVLHADGSMGLYGHIAPGSARVQPGDAVQPGQVLASVGNVGWSSAPHLHFSVQANDGRELLSLRFRMRGPEGTPLGDQADGAAASTRSRPADFAR
jgi:murein DD-endopeptidase MepM/ murein hydrolase activator NlpD